MKSELPGVIVMSATIEPSDEMPELSRRDPATRLQDYIEALRHFEALPTSAFNRIVFLENSGVDLTLLKHAFRRSDKALDFVSVATDSPATKGKGYGEFRMLDEGLSKSALIGENDLVWKVTGRLKILNMAEMQARAPTSYDVYCDLRDVPFIGESFGGNQWMELRIFSFRRSAYDRFFRGRYAESYVLEKSFFKSIKDEWLKGNGNIVPRFSIQPIIEGRAGFNNKNYRSLSYRAKDLLRATTRSIAPIVWL